MIVEITHITQEAITKRLRSPKKKRGSEIKNEK
jgi:hypothetical protein